MLCRNMREPPMLICDRRSRDTASSMASVQSPDLKRLSQVLTDFGVERAAGLNAPVEAFGNAADWGA
ncbi:MAG: hypothetical protein ACI9MR_005115 [Myxococcota bacterium]|jgi:hypothetical protein